MADIKNCKNCGKIFASISREICSDCYRYEEAAFQKVYQYLKKRMNRKAGIIEIMEATEVEEALILKFLKENRLRTSQFPNLGYPCERCATTISEGRFCANCMHEIKTGMKIEDNTKTDEGLGIYYTKEQENKKQN